jgi:cyclohexadienyl dehydratase
MAQALSNALSLPSPHIIIPSIWSNLTQDLAAEKFDMAMGGISITLARAATAFFSTPIRRVGKTGCIRCTDRAKYIDFASLDVAGVQIAANPGRHE